MKKYIKKMVSESKFMNIEFSVSPNIYDHTDLVQMGLKFHFERYTITNTGYQEKLHRK